MNSKFTKINNCKTKHYLNGVFPHPTIEIKILGPRSLAGFKPNPAFMPKVAPAVKTIKPIIKGAILAPTPIFL